MIGDQTCLKTLCALCRACSGWGCYWCSCHAGAAQAAEGGSSHYLPGLAGDIAIALVPEPGLQVAYGVYYQTGDLDQAILGGQANVDLSLDLVLNLVAASYTFETPVSGLNYTMLGILPFGYAKVDAALVVPGVGRVSDNADAFSLSDLTLVPFQLNWSVGDLSFKLGQAVYAPTGDFDEGRAANVGRNYWSFNTVSAVTWLYEKTGTEVSVAPGVMLNTRNTSTNYRTGHEFHVDFVGNQFVLEQLAIGLRGYYYRQFTADGGRGATLGSFRSEALGVCSQYSSATSDELIPAAEAADQAASVQTYRW